MPLSELPELDRPPARSRWLPPGAASTTSRLIGAASCQETSPDSAAGMPLSTPVSTPDLPAGPVPFEGPELADSAKAITPTSAKNATDNVRRRRRNWACRRARSAAVRTGGRRRPGGVEAPPRLWSLGCDRETGLGARDDPVLERRAGVARVGRALGRRRVGSPPELRSLIEPRSGRVPHAWSRHRAALDRSDWRARLTWVNREIGKPLKKDIATTLTRLALPGRRMSVLNGPIRAWPAPTAGTERTPRS